MAREKRMGRKPYLNAAMGWFTAAAISVTALSTGEATTASLSAIPPSPRGSARIALDSSAWMVPILSLSGGSHRPGFSKCTWRCRGTRQVAFFHKWRGVQRKRGGATVTTTAADTPEVFETPTGLGKAGPGHGGGYVGEAAGGQDPLLLSGRLANDTMLPLVNPITISDMVQAAGDAGAAAMPAAPAMPAMTPATPSSPAGAAVGEAGVAVVAKTGRCGGGGRLSELMAFTLPLLAIGLSSPIMSLIDTTVVGLRSSVQLAALSPATSVCDNVAYLCCFLQQVTTQLVVAGARSSPGEQDMSGVEISNLKSNRAILTGVTASLGVGLTITYTLLTHGRRLLGMFLRGNPESAASVLPFSATYVRIRALGFVAVTLSLTLQGACFAERNVRTPVKSVLGASMVNAVLDYITVFRLNMGIRGAALSTTAAQWAGALYLLRKVLPKMRSSGALRKPPRAEEVEAFLRLGGPTLLAVLGQVSTCLMVTKAASSCDTIALAAHQVMYGVFVLFCPVGEAVSQTVQAYLPNEIARNQREKGQGHGQGQGGDSSDSSDSLVSGTGGGDTTSVLKMGKKEVAMMKNILTVAAGLGAASFLLVSAATWFFPFVFTPDPDVQSAMRSISALCGLTLATHATTMGLHGMMMATRDVSSLATIYTITSTTFCTWFALMSRGPSQELTSVWKVFVIYQLTRFGLFATDVAVKYRRALLRFLVGSLGGVISRLQQLAAPRPGHGMAAGAGAGEGAGGGGGGPWVESELIRLGSATGFPGPNVAPPMVLADFTRDSGDYGYSEGGEGDGSISE